MPSRNSQSRWRRSLRARKELVAGGALCFALPMVLVVARAALSVQDAPPGGNQARAAALVRESQVAVSVDVQDGEVKFRASVVGRSAQVLQLLTAAHCAVVVKPGQTVKLYRERATCPAVVRRVVINPVYEGVAQTAVPGADNAYLVVETRPQDEAAADWVRSLAIVRLGTDAALPVAGGAAPFFSIDQFEKFQSMRGGNYSNPRWVEWGDSYRPIPGDSGSGLFLIGPDTRGEIRPLLVGVVTDRSALGGGASLVFLKMRWLADAMLDELDRGARK